MDPAAVDLLDPTTASDPYLSVERLVSLAEVTALYPGRVASPRLVMSYPR